MYHCQKWFHKRAMNKFVTGKESLEIPMEGLSRNEAEKLMELLNLLILGRFPEVLE